MRKVDARDARIAALEVQVAALTRRVAELVARLSTNSTNSSKPPSSDRPGTKRTGKQPTGRRPGGQPGHNPHKRDLVPPERVDHVVDPPPPLQCERCQHELEGVEQEALRHQVVELPPLKPIITEYRCHGVMCAHCGELNQAELPPEVAGRVFGERLSALACLLVGKYRLSKRKVQDALEDMMGVRLSLGAVSNREQEMSDALSSPVSEAERFIREQDRVHMDETGWVEGKVVLPSKLVDGDSRKLVDGLG